MIQKDLLIDGQFWSYYSNKADNKSLGSDKPLIVLLHPSSTDGRIMNEQLDYFANDDFHAIAPNLTLSRNKNNKETIDYLIQKIEEIPFFDELPITEFLELYSLQALSEQTQTIVESELNNNSKAIFIGVSLGGYVACQIKLDNEKNETFSYGIQQSSLSDKEKKDWILGSLSSYIHLNNSSKKQESAEHFLQRRRHYFGNPVLVGNSWNHYFEYMKKSILDDTQLFGLSHIALHVAISHYQGNANFANSDLFKDVKLPHIPVIGEYGKEFYKLIKTISSN
ncbi:MAG: alpha/beta fold hydrolase [Candidatus Woesearchaeota archaeon]